MISGAASRALPLHQAATAFPSYKVGTNGTIFAPQGGLRISYEELSHVLRLLINKGTFNGKRILSSSLVRE